MSLRMQIHDAIDEIAPPAPALEQTVTDYVFAGQKAHCPRHGRWVWTRRLRGLTTLAAAALVVVLVSGLFVAGRIWRDLNAPAPTINQAALKGLESRPLQLPVVPSGAACPVTRAALNEKFGMVIGSGPVYLSDYEIGEKTDWGYWISLTFIYDARSPGLVLVRAMDLQGTGEMAFAQYPLAPTGVTAVGSVMGTDQVVNHRVTLRSEAVFQDAAHTPAIGKQGKRPELIVLAGERVGGSPCVGFQFDGPGFTETFVV